MALMINQMVKHQALSLDAAFAALADPTRREIVRRLAQGELSISALAEPFDMSLVAVSKHIGVLEEAGLVSRRKVGRSHLCRLRGDALRKPAAWLDRTRIEWESRLDRLERYLEEDE